MLYVYVFDWGLHPPKWRELDNGPFPITRERLDDEEAR